MNKTQKDYLIILAMVVISVLVYFFFPERAETQASRHASDNSLTHSPSIMTTPNTTQLQIAVEQEGTGAPAQKGQTISVAYTGRLTDGTVFDSSIPRGEPFVLTLGNGEVIPGWEIGLLGMKVGEKRQLTIPSELAYGESGFPGLIPAGATLIFDVELLAIK